MIEQFGAIYDINPLYVAKPNKDFIRRIFFNALDNDLLYVKNFDGSIELLSSFIGAIPAFALTHAELLAKALASDLIIGGVYLITDFRTRYIIPNTAVVDTGAIEPLIVTASNVNTINAFAISSQFPQDEILYELEDSTTSGGDRGRIFYRKDNLINVSAGYNWRVVKFRRWETAPASGIYTVITDNGGAFLDFFTFNNSASAANCQQTSLLEITAFGISTFGAPTDKLNNTILNAVCLDTIIEHDNFNNTITADIIGGNRIQVAFIGNTINSVGGEIVDNIISPAFVNNTIGLEFRENNIKFQFTGNQIGDNFMQNVIASNFFLNTINNDFQRNVIGQNFALNLIGDDFADNVVGSDAQANIINNNFSVNQIFTKFQNNIILDNFTSNIVGGAFDGNINIQDNFRYNTITQGLSGIDFLAATHVYGDYTKNIFKNSAVVYRLSYVDGADTVIYTAVNA